jgi:hypothetical protein
MPIAATCSASPERAPNVKRDSTWAIRSDSASFWTGCMDVADRDCTDEHPATPTSKATNAVERRV